MTWIIPVGEPGGVISGFRQLPDGSRLVRLGSRFGVMDPERYRIWRLLEEAPREEELGSTGSEPNRLDPILGHIRELLDDGLAARVPFRRKQAAGTVVARTIGECLGNGTDREPTFNILGRNGTVVGVDVTVYEFVLRGDGRSSILVVCEELARSQDAIGLEGILELVGASLPALVRIGAIRLDSALS